MTEITKDRVLIGLMVLGIIAIIVCTVNIIILL